MSNILRPSLALIVLLLAVSFAHAQTDQRDSKPSASADAVLKGSIFQPSGDDVKKDDKTSAPKPASPQPADPSISDPLVRVLLIKGVITPEEARAVAGGQRLSAAGLPWRHRPRRRAGVSHTRAGFAPRRELRVARPRAEDGHHGPHRVRLRGRLHAREQP